jgi:PAS domain S-box-containing protein
MLDTEEERQGLKTYLASLVREQPPPQPYCAKNRTKDGRLIDVEVIWDYRRDETGQVTGFVSVISDVTDVKRAEAALRESEQRYRTLAESAEDMIFIIDRDDRVQYVNRYAAESVRHRAEDIIGRPRAAVFPPQIAERQAQSLRAVFESGEPVTVEGTLPAGDDVLWIHTRLAPLKAADGQVGAVLGISRDITDRKQAERALAESEARFRMLSESALTGVYIFGHGRMLYVNPAFAQMFGYSEEEIVAILDPFVLVHPDDRHIAAENIRRRLEGEIEVARYQFRGIRKDGSTVHCEAMGRHIEYEGSPAIIGTMMDITDRKRAEEALAESEARFRMLTESALTGIYVIQDGVFRYVNPALAASLGYEPGEIIDRLGPGDLTHPDDRDRVLDNVKRRLAGMIEATHYTLRGMRKDGRAIDLESLGRRVTYGGRPAIMGTLLDITNRLQAEQALRESEERHRTILDQMQEAVVFTDEGNVVRHINEFACSLFGTSRDEAIGRDAIAFHAPDLRPEVASIIERFRREPKRGVVDLRRTVRSRELAFRFSPVRDSSGRYLGVITTITDDTEHVRLQQQVAEARRMESVGTLAGGIAHDFNNLMATVLGLASYLKRRRRSDDSDYSKLAQIEDAAATAGRLAHQLLDFARGGRILPRLSDFREVVAHGVAVFDPTKPPNVKLTRHIAKDLWQVECDATQIERVVVNLCRNAVEAMSDGGRLTVKAENVERRAPLNKAKPPLPAGNYVCLTIKDTGCGIDPEIVDRVFDPFFTTKNQGHGLGLAATYGIVRGHGGAISVTSQPGKGSTFRIWLPRATVQPAVRPTTEGKPHDASR